MAVANSSLWKKRQFSDPFVKQAQKENYRARSVYKLEELDQKYGLTKNCQIAIDLGCAPGAWSQYLVKKLANNKNVILVSVDLLFTEELQHCTFIQGNFCSPEIQESIISTIKQPAQLIVSDMAPNMSGVRVVDNAKAMYLCEVALDFCQTHLAQGGHFVCKVFQGEGFDDFYALLKRQFEKTYTSKPKSSRKESREVYLVAKSKH